MKIFGAEKFIIEFEKYYKMESHIVSYPSFYTDIIGICITYCIW